MNIFGSVADQLGIQCNVILNTPQCVSETIPKCLSTFWGFEITSLSLAAVTARLPDGRQLNIY